MDTNFHFKAIVHYDISNDKTREDFTSLLANLQFIAQHNQSTWGLPHRKIPAMVEVIPQLEQFYTEHLNEEDFIDLFLLIPSDFTPEQHTIKRYYFHK